MLIFRGVDKKFFFFPNRSDIFLVRHETRSCLRTFFTQGWCLGSSGAVASKVFASMSAPALVTPSGVPKEQLETEAREGRTGGNMEPIGRVWLCKASQKLSKSWANYMV